MCPAVVTIARVLIAAGAARSDVVYLANAATLGAATSTWLLGSVSSSSLPTLAGGASTSEAIQATIPNVPAGNDYLVYVLNNHGAQAETDAANDQKGEDAGTASYPRIDAEKLWALRMRVGQMLDRMAK